MIVHTVPSLGLSGGGPPRSVSQLCGALSDVSIDKITILTARYPDDTLVPLADKIRLVTHPGRGMATIDRLKKTGFKESLKCLTEDGGVAVIHQHGIWLSSSHEVTDLAAKSGIPHIIAPRGMLEPWAINNSKWKKKLAWALYQKRDLEKASAFHATAQSEAGSIRGLGFKQPIAVIPNGIVLPDVPVRSSSFLVPGSSLEGESSRSENEEPRTKNEAQRTALFLSRINPKKGLPMLLDAWAKVAPADWRLVIAGNDDSNHLPVVKRKIQELGLSDQVEIAGPLFGEAQEAAYRNANLFVLPSYSENFGIVVAEALSYGVPVLTTTGCPWQELQTHHCGWWVEPTPVCIEAGLNEALSTQNEELTEMGVRGRDLVEEKYQWPGIAERMSDFYYWLLNGGKQPDFVV